MRAERRPGIPGDLSPDRGRGAVLSLDARLDLGALSLELRVESSARRIAICGASGAGKSSCLRVVAGLERRSRGRVDVLGERWQGEPGRFVPPWSRGVGWVPQDALLLPHRTVRENLLWAHQDADGGELSRVVELLEIGRLVDRRPRNLSGGERQRVALGRALLARPRLLLLDEPLSALDRGHRGRVAQVIDAWARQHGVPLVLVSHDERDVASLADEVWVMEQGRLSRG